MLILKQKAKTCNVFKKTLRRLIENKVPTISVGELTDSILYQNSIVYANQYRLYDILATPLTPQEANVFIGFAS